MSGVQEGQGGRGHSGLGDLGSQHVMLVLVSPERVVYSKPVDMVVIPGAVGDFGVLPHHEALISLLRPGIIEIFQGGKAMDHIYVTSGFVQVADNTCHVLADEMMPVSEIDLEALQTFIQNTEEYVAMAPSEEERSALKESLRWAQIKLNIVRHLSRRLGKSS